jgi:hypothetical protein
LSFALTPAAIAASPNPVIATAHFNMETPFEYSDSIAPVFAEEKMPMPSPFPFVGAAPRLTPRGNG